MATAAELNRGICIVFSTAANADICCELVEWTEHSMVAAVVYGNVWPTAPDINNIYISDACPYLD